MKTFFNTEEIIFLEKLWKNSGLSASKGWERMKEEDVFYNVVYNNIKSYYAGKGWNLGDTENRISEILGKWIHARKSEREVDDFERDLVVHYQVNEWKKEIASMLEKGAKETEIILLLRQLYKCKAIYKDSAMKLLSYLGTLKCKKKIEYEIYQLDSNCPNVRDLAFSPLKLVEELGLKVKFENYHWVYGGTLPDENLSEEAMLEGLFCKFNTERPNGFRGHSLSVSDVIILKIDGYGTYWYCDRFGFSKIPDFFEQ